MELYAEFVRGNPHTEEALQAAIQSVFTHVPDVKVHAYVVCACVPDVKVHVHIHVVCAWICIYIHMYVHDVHVDMHMHVHVCMYVCVSQDETRHHRTWRHLQCMFPPTPEGLSALKAEIAGSDGDFSNATQLEIEIKTELYKREGDTHAHLAFVSQYPTMHVYAFMCLCAWAIPNVILGVYGVAEMPLHQDVAEHYALLYALLCDAVAKDMIEDMHCPPDLSNVPTPPLKMPHQPYDDSCYGCGYSFSTGVYGYKFVGYCCGFKQELKNGTVLCCRAMWHGHCAALKWAPGSETVFIGPCGHACMATADAQQIAVDAIAQAEVKERALQVHLQMPPCALFSSQLCICMHTFSVCICVCAYVNMYVYVHTCIRMCMCMCMCMCIRIYICMCMCMCTLICMCVCQVAGWQEATHPGHLLEDADSAMEQSFLGDVLYERDAFLSQVIHLSDFSPHSERLAAKRSLVHLLAQTSNLQASNASKITAALQPHMHLLLLQERVECSRKPQDADSSGGTSPFVVPETPIPQAMELIPVKEKKEVRRSAVGSSKGEFTVLCADPDMIDAVDSKVGFWADPANLKDALKRLFCSGQAKLTGGEWTLSNVSSVLVSVVSLARNSQDHHPVDYRDAKQRGLVSLQLMLHLQKRNFVSVTPEDIRGNATVSLKVLPCPDDETTPLIATSALVSSHGWCVATIEACVGNFNKEKYSAKKRKKVIA